MTTRHFLHGEEPYDPRWFRKVQHGKHAGVVEVGGTVLVYGERLRFNTHDKGLPPGTPVKLWLERSFVCATSADLDLEAAQAKAATERHAREVARRAEALREAAAAFNSRIQIPVAWDVAYKTVLSGLLEHSMGNGANKATVDHIRLLEPLSDGRLKREAGDLLCGTKASLWIADGNNAKVTCKACLKLAQRWITE